LYITFGVEGDATLYVVVRVGGYGEGEGGCGLFGYVIEGREIFAYDGFGYFAEGPCRVEGSRESHIRKVVGGCQGEGQLLLSVVEGDGGCSLDRKRLDGSVLYCRGYGSLGDIQPIQAEGVRPPSLRGTGERHAALLIEISADVENDWLALLGEGDGDSCRQRYLGILSRVDVDGVSLALNAIRQMEASRFAEGELEVIRIGTENWHEEGKLEGFGGGRTNQHLRRISQLLLSQQCGLRRH